MAAESESGYPRKSRRSSRSIKAAENARFMAFAGLVVGIVIGLLIGIKFNIGARAPVYIEVPPKAAESGNELTGRFHPVDPVPESTTNNQEVVDVARLGEYSGPVDAQNPVRGTWRAKYNRFAVILRFTPEMQCEIYEPIPASDASQEVRLGKRLAAVDYTLTESEAPAEWRAVEDRSDLFKWPDFALHTSFTFKNRDGTTGTGDKIHPVDLTASFEGKDTPQDTDDFIVYEMQLGGEFFDVPGDLNFSLPAGRRWERRVEADFRNESGLEF